MPYLCEEQATCTTIIPKSIKQTLVIPCGSYLHIAAFKFGAIGTETDHFTSGYSVSYCQINLIARFHNQKGKSSLFSAGGIFSIPSTVTACGTNSLPAPTYTVSFFISLSSFVWET